MLHQSGEVAFSSRFLQHQATVETIAAFQLVADHKAATVLQQGPDARVEIPWNLLQRSETDSVLQPVPTAGGLLQRVRHLPLHAATDVKLFAALQGCSGMFHIGKKGSQSVTDQMR